MKAQIEFKTVELELKQLEKLFIINDIKVSNKESLVLEVIKLAGKAVNLLDNETLERVLGLKKFF